MAIAMAMRNAALLPLVVCLLLKDGSGGDGKRFPALTGSQNLLHSFFESMLQFCIPMLKVGAGEALGTERIC